MKDLIEQKVYLPRGIKDHGDYRAFFRRQLKALKQVRKGEFYDPEEPRMLVVS